MKYEYFTNEALYSRAQVKKGDLSEVLKRIRNSKVGQSIAALAEEE